MVIRGIGFDYQGVIGEVTAHAAHPYERMLQLVDRLRNAGYRVGLLSNAPGDWADAFDTAGLSDHFDTVLLAGAIGHAKPDSEAFAALATALGVDLAELVFIDDSPACIAGTASYGLRPILYTGYHDLLAKFSALGIRV